MKALNIQKVVYPDKKPKTLNGWVNYIKHTHKILISSKSKDSQYIPKI